MTAHARHVKIKEEGVRKCAAFLAQRLQSGVLSLDDLFTKTAVHPQTADAKAADWVFFTAALNFSFWTMEDQPQYTVLYKVSPTLVKNTFVTVQVHFYSSM